MSTAATPRTPRAPRTPRRRTVRGMAGPLVGLVAVALAVVFALPQVSARFAERRAESEATELGGALVENFIRTGSFPRHVVADNTDGSHPEVLADGRRVAGVELAPGMAIYYYSSEPRNLGMGFCLEHRPHNARPDAFAVYHASGKTAAGDIGQTGHGDGCLSAE